MSALAATRTVAHCGLQTAGESFAATRATRTRCDAAYNCSCNRQEERPSTVTSPSAPPSLVPLSNMSIALQVSGHVGRRGVCDYEHLIKHLRACRKTFARCDLYLHTWDEIAPTTPRWRGSRKERQRPEFMKSSLTCFKSIVERTKPVASMIRGYMSTPKMRTGRLLPPATTGGQRSCAAFETTLQACAEPPLRQGGSAWQRSSASRTRDEACVTPDRLGWRRRRR